MRFGRQGDALETWRVRKRQGRRTRAVLSWGYPGRLNLAKTYSSE